MKAALITGVTGQDGSYLAEDLLEKGYRVYGFARPTATPNHWRIKNVIGDDHFKLIEGDMTDAHSIMSALETIKQEHSGHLEVYNFAAHSFVGSSWDMPESVMNINALGLIRLLNGLRNVFPGARIYQASSSEMFGKVRSIPQSEQTPFHPRSPYGLSKVAAFWAAVNYRESFDMFVCNGILFNHESPRRGREFVTQKVIREAVRITEKLNRYLVRADSHFPAPLVLGNLDAKRDWGHAKDYVRAAYLMLQQEQPDDYVVATGQATSVRAFVEEVFDYLGHTITWRGEGLKEVGYSKEQSVAPIIEISERFYRPAEVDLLIGDASKAKEKLRWEPEYDLTKLVSDMIIAEKQRML